MEKKNKPIQSLVNFLYVLRNIFSYLTQQFKISLQHTYLFNKNQILLEKKNYIPGSGIQGQTNTVPTIQAFYI